MGGLIGKLGASRRVYKRIRYFDRMYPLGRIASDLILFPWDYLRTGQPIRRLNNLTVAVTHRCNLRCRMCYFHQELENAAQLPLELYTRVIETVAPARPCVILSGGEPFTHPDLIEMVAAAKNRRLPVQIFSNGVLAKPEVTGELIRLGLDYINLTLLGDQETHSLVAGLPGTYDRFRANLERLAANRGQTRVMINYTLTPTNVEQLSHAVDLVKELRLDGLRIQHYNYLRPQEFTAQERVMANLFGRTANTNEIEPSEDATDMAGRIRRMRAEIDRADLDAPIQWAPDLNGPELDNWYSGGPFKTTRKCLFPWRGMLLDADGRLYPCSKIYLELGRVDREDAWQAWNSESMDQFRRQLKKGLFPACARCCKL